MPAALNISWKQWKLGLFIAVLTGIAAGAVGFVAGLVVGLSKQQLLVLAAVNFGASVGKDLLLYLQQHPADSVTFDTTHITKDTITHTESTIKTPSDTTPTIPDGSKPT